MSSLLSAVDVHYSMSVGLTVMRVWPPATGRHNQGVQASPFIAIRRSMKMAMLRMHCSAR